MSSHIAHCRLSDPPKTHTGSANIPDIDEKQDCGSEMRKGCDTLHLNGVHLLERVVETALVSIRVENQGEGLISKGGQAALRR